MMNRRRALVAVGIAALGAIEWHILRRRQPNQSTRTSFTVSGAELSDAADNNLTAEIARTGSRVYSEEGVPMFLACQNLAEPGTAPVQAPLPSALNRKVASAFRRYSEEWQHLQPDATASDVAKILELLADRDFASGGTEKSL